MSKLYYVHMRNGKHERIVRVLAASRQRARTYALQVLTRGWIVTAVDESV